MRVGDRVRLTAKGVEKMRIGRYVSVYEASIDRATVVSIDDSGYPPFVYVEFDTIRRPDGKKRFAFVDGDLEVIVPDDR